MSAMLILTSSLGLSNADFPVGPVLFVLFVIAGNILRFYLKAEFNKGKEIDEEREVLSKEKLERTMAVADTVFSERLDYYRHLSEKGKEKFRARTRVILATKKFYGKQGMKLTPEVELLTAAAFVQVTFGLRRFHLGRFHRIYIYPEVFYNKLLDKNLKGSTSPIGVLRFSWKHLEYGFRVGDDNINLALHEVAHALKVAIDEGDNRVDTHLDEELAEFQESGDEMRSAILEGKLTLIRKYAATNEHEFFACCVEYFFESPEHFKSNLPQLFRRMAAILNQDPTRKEHDYHIDILEKPSPSIHFPQAFSPSSKTEDDELNWVPSLIALGLFIGAPITLYLHWNIVSEVPTVLLFHATFLILGISLFYRKLYVSGYTSTLSFSFFLLGGWWPIVSAVTLAINMAFPLYSFTMEDQMTAWDFEGRKVTVIAKESELRMLRKGIEATPELIVHLRRFDEYDITIQSHLYYGPFGLIVYNGYDYSLRFKSP